MFWQTANKVASTALTSKALLPIATNPDIVSQNGVDFVVHTINHNLRQKIKEKHSTENPFLPYQKSMYVADAGSKHVCLLNRFPVLADHLLICTKAFAAQNSPLTQADFSAWLMGIDGGDVFGFYNGGPLAGASQRHRHMQLVKTRLPLESLILSGKLPFQHQLFQFDGGRPENLYRQYQSALQSLNLFDGTTCAPYNLLVKNNWMLLLPRTQSNIEHIFLNGINYGGIFLLRNDAQKAWAKEYGFINILRSCSRS